MDAKEPMIATQPVHGTLIEQAVALLEHRPLDQVSLRRLRNEAQAAMHADPAASHIVLGILSCMEGNVAEMHQHHRIAINLDSQSYMAYENYIVSLQRSGFYREAWQLAQESLEKFPDVKSLLELAVRSAFYSGRVHQAAEMLEHRWHKISPETDNVMATRIDDVAGVCNELGLNDDMLSHAIEAAYETIRELASNVSSTVRWRRFNTMEWDGKPFLAYDVGLDIPIEKTSNINEKFIEKTLQYFALDNGLVITYASAKIENAEHYYGD
ncbi:hypothetical protein ACJU26_05870 [Acidithiobacillus sp. M4-SHS-6]|uniref:hypothetical protein n=1 Tax=Acidithiobacillus sp. M4-SHS-6 TaxID=3383024 RepID=UPI0039BE7E1D